MMRSVRLAAASAVAHLQRHRSLSCVAAQVLLYRRAPHGVRLMTASSSTGSSEPGAASGGAAATAPHPGILVQFGRGGQFLLHRADDGADLTKMQPAAVLKSMTSCRVFSQPFQGVKLSRCSLRVLPMLSGSEEPDASSKGVLVKDDEALGAAAVKAGWQGTGELFVRVVLPDQRVADAACFPPPPVPITFTKAGFNDETGAPMHTATVDGVPIFLPDFALQQVQAWASGELSSKVRSQRGLVLTGPTKSGKTTLLKLLPRFLKPTGRRPVVFSFTFQQGVPPPAAAQQLVDAALKLAADLDIVIYTSKINANALRDFPEIIGDLAEGVYAAGGEFILLLDEVQAPLLAATDRKKAADFCNNLKPMQQRCRSSSRVAITGGGMLTLQHAIYCLPTNDFPLWVALRPVCLGATPSAHEQALLMAHAVIAARAEHWSQTVRDLVTPSFVLQCLERGEAVSDGNGEDLGAAPPWRSRLRLTSTRPALVAHFCDLVGAAKADAPTRNVVATAMAAIRQKLLEDSSKDVAVALGAIYPKNLEPVSKLAQGHFTFKRLMGWMDWLGDPCFAYLLERLCEPAADGETLKVFPPYDAILSSALGKDGTLLMKWRDDNARWEMTARMTSKLSWYGKRATKMLVAEQPELAACLSTAVLGAMVEQGHGVPVSCSDATMRPPETLEELASIPAVQAIYKTLEGQEPHQRASATSSAPSVETLLGKTLVLATGGPEASGALPATAGVQLLLSLTRIGAHTYVTKRELLDARVTLAMTEHLLDAAIVAYCEKTGLRRDPATGLPKLPSSSPATPRTHQ